MEANQGLRITEGTMEQVISPEALSESAVDGIVHLGQLLNVAPGRWVTVTAAADDYRASIPSAAFTAGAVLDAATSRLRVSDGDTLCWNVKGVTDLDIGDRRLADSVPENPTH